MISARGVVVIAVGLGALPSSGCLRFDDCGPAPGPNGVDDELNFAVELGHDIGEGLHQTVLIPERVDGTRADTWRLTEPFSVYDEACHDPFVVDFAETTIEVQGDDVLDASAFERNGSDYHLRVACRPGPYPVEQQTAADGFLHTTQRSGVVRVRVLSGSDVRYDDGFGFRCWQTDELALRLRDPQATYRVGDEFYILYEIGSTWLHEHTSTGETDSIRQALEGRGLEVRGTDPPIEILGDTAGSLRVRAIRSAQSVVIAAGTVESSLAVAIADCSPDC
jgi:hypothetical protein